MLSMRVGGGARRACVCGGGLVCLCGGEGGDWFVTSISENNTAILY